MASAVRWQLLQQLLSMLQAQTWAPEEDDEGVVRAIDPVHAIVFRKISSTEREDNIGHSGDILPGIIVSCPRTDCEMNYEHGSNVLDQVPIRFLMQFIDRDNKSKKGGEKTYWKWQEQCWAMLNEAEEKIEDFEAGSQGDLVAMRIKYINTVDERYWVRHDAFVAGIELEFQVQFHRS